MVTIIDDCYGCTCVTFDGRVSAFWDGNVWMLYSREGSWETI